MKTPRHDAAPSDPTFAAEVRCLALAAALDAVETQPDMPDLGSIYWSLERAAVARGIRHGGQVFDAAAAWLGVPYCRHAGLYLTPDEAAAFRRGSH